MTPDELLPQLYEDAYRAAKEFSSLQVVGMPLLDGYAQTGKSERAVALANELLAAARTQLSPDSPQLAGQLAALSQPLLWVKAFAEAELLLRECLAIREKQEPNVWTTFNTKSKLGGALLGQKKFADADLLLLSGYEVMKQREANIPQQGRIRFPEAVDRLIELYAAIDKPDEAAKWQSERVKYPIPSVSSPEKQ